MVECELSRIVIREDSLDQYIFLREKGGKRSFRIVIGQSEANEINRKVIGVHTKRPLTHDLLRSAVRELGAKIVGIEVNDLRNNTFYANLILEQGERLLRVDCRPSDAIALAAAEQVTIEVDEVVLNHASQSEEGA